VKSRTPELRLGDYIRTFLDTSILSKSPRIEGDKFRFEYLYYEQVRSVWGGLGIRWRLTAVPVLLDGWRDLSGLD
jgi:hypothetical protein